MKMSSSVVALAIVTLVFTVSCAGKTVHGRVLDSVTGKGIRDVTVTARQIGWGKENGYFVWDKVYDYSTRTDNDGNFELTYTRGGASVHLIFSKEGYHSTRAGYPLQDTYLDYRQTAIVHLARD